MTDREWETIELLLSKGWKGEFGPGESRAYRLLLDGYEPEQIVMALRQLLAKGTAFVPACSEVVQAINGDPDRPTFTEAYELIYGPRGVLLAASPTGRMYANEAEMLAARGEAQLDYAYERHPLLGAFCQSYGVHRLAMLPVEDPDIAGIVRRDLQREWERFVDANEHRDAAALAAGRRRELSRGPRKPGFQAVLPQGEGLDEDEPF